MGGMESFTIKQARRDRISKGTRRGYKSGINQVKKWLLLEGKEQCLRPCRQEDYIQFDDGQTIDSTVFQNEDFLGFLEWTVRNKAIGVETLMRYKSTLLNLYKDDKVPLPNEFGDDIKEVFSGTQLKSSKLI